LNIFAGLYGSPLFRILTIVYLLDGEAWLSELCRRASSEIVPAFDKFFAQCIATANTDPKLRKELGSSDLPISGRNSFFFRNVLNYNALGFSGSFNCSEEIAS